MAFSLVWNYVARSFRRDKRSLIIGTTTVFLVVMFVCFVQNALNTSSVIFLKSIEDDAGQADFMFQPETTNKSTSLFVNQPALDLRLKYVTDVVGTTPRWYFLGGITNREFQENKTSVLFLITNTEEERQLGIGRVFKHRPLGEAETHVTGSILRDIGIRPNRGDRVLLNFNLTTIMDMVGGDLSGSGDTNATVGGFLEQLGIDTRGLNQSALNQTVDPTSSAFNIDLDYAVVDAVEFPDGKFPSALGNVALMDSRYTWYLLSRALIDQITRISAAAVSDEQVRNFFSNISSGTTSLQSLGTMTNRLHRYTLAGDASDYEFIHVTNDIFEALGDDYPVTLTIPLKMAMGIIKFLKLFLDQIFNGVIAVLALLGALLIFSLMLSNVEEKTYEYGMLRALGLSATNLIQLLLTTAGFFAVPGIALGLLAAFVLFGIMIAVMGPVVAFDIPPNFSLQAVLFSAGIGIVLPIISNILPIRRALSSTLRDSLDLYHQTFAETTVTFTYLSRLGISPAQTIVALTFVILGFCMYYLAPMAFLYGNLSLFLTILLFLMLGMILGLSVVSITIQPFLERVILHLLVWGRDRRFKHMVRKNLSGHRPRNRKTALMFTITLSFLIFAGAMFSLQAKNISTNVEMMLGSDIVMTAPAVDKALKEMEIREYFNTTKHSIVIEYSFATFPLNNLRYIEKTDFSNLATFPDTRVSVLAVERQYLESAYRKFFYVTRTDPDIKYSKHYGTTPDVFRSLYDNAGEARLSIESETIPVPVDLTTGPVESKPGGSRHRVLTVDPAALYNNYIDVVVPEALAVKSSLDTDTALRLEIYISTNKYRTYTTLNYLAKARAFAKKAPGLTMGSYPSMATGSSHIITTDQYMRILRKANEVVRAEGSVDPETVKDPDRPPMQRLFVRVTSEATQGEIETLINGLRNFIPDETTTVMDTRKMVAMASVSGNLINIFFIVVAVISITLCFFVLWISFTSNISENSWEFGVIRSLGLTGWQTIRLYVYEALSIVLACLLLGTLIGFLIAITLTLQMNQFMELPFGFDFPTPLFLACVALSILTAFIGSYRAAAQMRKKDIAIVLRGG